MALKIVVFTAMPSARRRESATKVNPGAFHNIRTAYRTSCPERFAFCFSYSVGRALPILTGRILIEFSTRLREDGKVQTILAFDEWLQTQQP